MLSQLRMLSNASARQPKRSHPFLFLKLSALTGSEVKKLAKGERILVHELNSCKPSKHYILAFLLVPKFCK